MLTKEEYIKKKIQENNQQKHLAYKEEYRKQKIKEAHKKKFTDTKKKDAYEKKKEQNVMDYYSGEHKNIKKKEFVADKKDKNICRFYQENYVTEKQIREYMDKRNTHPIHKIIDNLSTRTNMVLKKHKITRNLTHLQLIGCDYTVLQEHLESQFIPGMTFDNYGDWEVDHIIPISKFEMESEEDVLKCFNYKNLQPLWKKDNRSKSNKLIPPHSTPHHHAQK